MPLKRGISPEVVKANIEELLKSGKSLAQAVAIAMATKRESQEAKDKRKKG